MSNPLALRHETYLESPGLYYMIMERPALQMKHIFLINIFFAKDEGRFAVNGFVTSCLCLAQPGFLSDLEGFVSMAPDPRSNPFSPNRSPQNAPGVELHLELRKCPTTIAYTRIMLASIGIYLWIIIVKQIYKDIRFPIL